MLEHYERCLIVMLERMHGLPDYADALIYEQRLLENIACTRKYGNSDLRQSDRAEILDHLNRFCLHHLSCGFLDLCEEQERRNEEILVEVLMLVREIHELMQPDE
jgi:hypothetical protein